MIPADLRAFIESGLSTLVGTANAQLRPLCMRAVGVYARDGGHAARVYLPCVDAALTVENLLSTRRIAVTLSKPPTHRTVQLKGDLLNIAMAPTDERDAVERLFQPFLSDLAYLGIPRVIVERANRWPCWSVDFSVQDVFVQTPGPRAGLPLATCDLL